MINPAAIAALKPDRLPPKLNPQKNPALPHPLATDPEAYFCANFPVGFMMKKILITLAGILMMGSARADEGMWIPSLIGKNYDEMVRLGLKLSKEDLYSINHSSLKDAVVQFGGGCTAEMVSAQGLLITNHHCGYDAIATLSSVGNNYLDNGFWALSKAQELPAAGVTVIYLQRIEDVTGEINKAIGKSTGEKTTKKMDAIRKKIEDRAGMSGKYVANVKEYFNGNQYLLLVYKKYTDVRLVGTPPRSLGKFGGDTDNWIWPRHTADFSMFRVYAGKDNEPAAYSKDNVPYRPAKYLPVSAHGVQEGDYAMIFGYPGRTNRYEVSGGVDLAVTETNPDIVRLRDRRLAIMKKHMDADKSVYLKMTSRYQSISNYWKYFIGQTAQLQRLHVVDQKKAEEQAFNKWSYKNGDKYNGLLKDYNAIFTTYRPYARHNVYYSECFGASSLAKLGASLEPLEKALLAGNTSADTIKKYTDGIKAARTAILKGTDIPTDKEIFAAMAMMFYTDVPKSQLPGIYDQVIFKQYGSENKEKTFADYTDHVYRSTFLLDSNRFNAFIANPTLAAISADPAAQFSLSFVHNFNNYYLPRVERYANAKKEYSKRYVRGLMEMNKGELMYPDANSTMRITYGKVKSYGPQDGVHYEYFTTSKGLLEKYKPGDDEFDLPKEVVTLVRNKDFGPWMDKSDSTLHTCFITNNDITGGNSGSPVINAKGEWIGAAFDGNWEAMSGDIAFDKKYKRTIVCDSRYILFLIDKLGGARNLIEEMDIRY